jgi:hypothetical protein
MNTKLRTYISEKRTTEESDEIWIAQDELDVK